MQLVMVGKKQLNFLKMNSIDPFIVPTKSWTT